MPTRLPSDLPASGVALLAAWLRRWLVGLLLVSYLLAAFVPAPGVWLRDLGIRPAEGHVEIAPVRFSLVMVGVLLLCGALSVDAVKLRELFQRPLAITAALGLVWAPPLAVVAVWSSIAPMWLPVESAASLAVGLALAGAMPVANSAVAWTHQSGGSLIWALGLVVLSICVCPWGAPLLLKLMGLSLSATSVAQANLLVSQFTGVIFAVWVLGPTLLGLALREGIGRRTIDRCRPWLTIVSAAALLLLNYANAASALPQVVAEPDWQLLSTTLVAAVSLPVAGLIPAWWAAGRFGLSRRGRVAWAYSVGMKNTGLALGLAGATLGEAPITILAILAVTLTQHAVAGGVHSFASRYAARWDTQLTASVLGR